MSSVPSCFLPGSGLLLLEVLGDGDDLPLLVALAPIVNLPAWVLGGVIFLGYDIFLGCCGGLLEFLGSMASVVFLEVPGNVILIVDVGGCLSSVGVGLLA